MRYGNVAKRNRRDRGPGNSNPKAINDNGVIVAKANDAATRQTHPCC